MVKTIGRLRLIVTITLMVSVIFMTNPVSAGEDHGDEIAGDLITAASSILSIVTVGVPALMMGISDRDNNVVSVISLIPSGLGALIYGFIAFKVLGDHQNDEYINQGLVFSGLFVMHTAILTWSIVRLSYDSPKGAKSDSYIQPAKASFGFAPMEDGLLFSFGSSF